MYAFQRTCGDVGEAVSRNAGAALLGGESIPGWQVRMWTGGLPSTQMERVASPRGIGVHGDAVHVGGTDTGQRHASAIELFRHRRASETFSPETKRAVTQDGIRANGQTTQETFGQYSIPLCKAGYCSFGVGSARDGPSVV